MVAKPKQARSSRKWHRWRRVVQVLVLVLFLYLLLTTQPGSGVSRPHDLFFRLDPLAGIAAMLASRTWMAPLALGGITLLLTLVVGRAWCSWLCPLGLVLDWTPGHRPKNKNRALPAYWRQGKYFLLFTILLAAVFGSLTLVIFDPVTLLFRTIGSTVLPALNLAVTTIETGLYHFPPLQPALDWFDSLARGWFLTAQPFSLPNLTLMVVFAAVLALNAIRPRFWCRYLCPLGGLLGLISKMAPVKYRVDTEKCIACQRCATICPTAAIEPQQKFAANPAECITCLDCLEVCPTRAITFSSRWALGTSQYYDPARRQFLVSLGAAAIGAVLLRTIPGLKKTEPQLVRPPGAAEDQLLSQCIRCGECARVCPTGSIQPSSSISTWEGLWTPGLIMRLGYCDYSCNSCGQACPTGAIPRLSLEQKRETIIGIARIDEERCIPWAEDRECIVCEEMCPVPQKAIRIDGQRRAGSRIKTTQARLPRVLPHLCIGCGICEYQCPVKGQAAIRIYTRDEYHQNHLQQ